MLRRAWRRRRLNVTAAAVRFSASLTHHHALHLRCSCADTTPTHTHPHALGDDRLDPRPVQGQDHGDGGRQGRLCLRRQDDQGQARADATHRRGGAGCVHVMVAASATARVRICSRPVPYVAAVLCSHPPYSDIPPPPLPSRWQPLPSTGPWARTLEKRSRRTALSLSLLPVTTPGMAARTCCALRIAVARQAVAVLWLASE